jgi:hypothetical protein
LAVHITAAQLAVCRLQVNTKVLQLLASVLDVPLRVGDGPKAQAAIQYSPHGVHLTGVAKRAKNKECKRSFTTS